MAQPNKWVMICDILFTIMIATIALATIPESYFMGAYVAYSYTNTSGLYNMSDGCLLTMPNCNPTYAICHDPFYSECVSAGIIGILLGSIINTLFCVVVWYIYLSVMHPLSHKNTNEEHNININNVFNTTI